MSPPNPADYRKTAQTHRRGTRADQPAATDVLAGTLYYVTDESVIERSNGVAWQSYSGAGITVLWSVLTNGDPTSPELIFAGGDVIMVHTP